jgi:hypothetical protein
MTEERQRTAEAQEYALEVQAECQRRHIRLDRFMYIYGVVAGILPVGY